MKNKYIFIIVSIVLVCSIVIVFVQKGNQKTITPVVGEIITKIHTQKTDFKGEKPTDFPGNIPTESGAKIEQSYELNYSSQRQLTISFVSSKTINENYVLYKDFLTKDGWEIVNNHEGTEVSSLYAIKNIDEINVTISRALSDSREKTLVSISFLKK